VYERYELFGCLMLGVSETDEDISGQSWICACFYSYLLLLCLSPRVLCKPVGITVYYRLKRLSEDETMWLMVELLLEIL
jgi:hypothetical protein